MHLLFVHKPNAPLSGAFESTADAVPTGDSDGQVREPRSRREDDLPLPEGCGCPGLPPLQGEVARHGSKADAATHHCVRAEDVLPVGTGCRCREKALG